MYSAAPLNYYRRLVHPFASLPPTPPLEALALFVSGIRHGAAVYCDDDEFKVSARQRMRLVIAANNCYRRAIHVTTERRKCVSEEYFVPIWRRCALLSNGGNRQFIASLKAKPQNAFGTFR